MVVLIVASFAGGPGGSSSPTSSHRVRHLPPYWHVHPGDTFNGIAARTGLTIDQLQQYNPSVDPDTLSPGQRLNLWAHPPVRRLKPAGPLYWKVRSGDSFGLIAAKTRIDITRLQQLNPHLKPDALQPGDRVRLRH